MYNVHVHVLRSKTQMPVEAHRKKKLFFIICFVSYPVFFNTLKIFFKTFMFIF